MADIDAACSATGGWPDAILSGHALNYQRFTRLMDGRQIPFVIAGAGGHNTLPVRLRNAPRLPVFLESLSNGKDRVVLEAYDDPNFGFLRVNVDSRRLRLSYVPMTRASCGRFCQRGPIESHDHSLIPYEWVLRKDKGSSGRSLSRALELVTFFQPVPELAFWNRPPNQALDSCCEIPVRHLRPYQDCLEGCEVDTPRCTGALV